MANLGRMLEESQKSRTPVRPPMGGMGLLASTTIQPNTSPAKQSEETAGERLLLLPQSLSFWYLSLALSSAREFLLLCPKMRIDAKDGNVSHCSECFRRTGVYMSTFGYILCLSLSSISLSFARSFSLSG